MKKLMDLLWSTAKDREDRIDKLLETLRAQGGDSRDTSDLRDLVTSEIKHSQQVRSWVVGLMLVCIVVALGGMGWSWNLDQRQRRALDFFQTENLPVGFQNSTTGDLRVRFLEPDQDPHSPVADQVRALARNSQGFGRHPGLGESRELPTDLVQYEDGLRFLVYPVNERAILGQTTIQFRNGRLETQADAIVPGGPPRAFEDLANFAVVLRRFDDARREWSVGFCERAIASAEYACGSGEYVVKKSPAGRRQEQFLVSGLDWTGAYLVSIGLGEQGESGRVWTVNARATRLSWTRRIR